MTTIQLDSGWELERGTTGATYRCRFTLEPLDWCASYWLHISAHGVQGVRLRAEQVENAAGVPFMADVTDLLTLDDNLLELSLASTDAALVPGSVWLEAVPCDEP